MKKTIVLLVLLVCFLCCSYAEVSVNKNRLIKEAEDSYKDVYTKLDNKYKEYLSEINELRKKMYVNSKDTKPVTKNHRNIPIKYVKKFRWLEATINDFRYAISEHKKLIPGKTFFRKLDKENITGGCVGEIIDHKIRIVKILTPNSAVADIPVTVEHVRQERKKDGYLIIVTKYTWKRVKLITPTEGLKPGQITDKADGIYSITTEKQGKKEILVLQKTDFKSA
jgi:hypothetical protein